MRLSVIDTETTGVDELDQVLELTVVNVRQKADRKRTKGPAQLTSYEEDHWHTLFKPTVAVSLGARATHYILDGELDRYPTLEALTGLEVCDWFLPVDTLDEVILVAHNAEFDIRLLRQSLDAAGVHPPDILPGRHICTWICGQHLYPDSPGHSNQVLRYYLNLDELYPDMLEGAVDPEGRMLPPHRALPDALITSRLLMEMLRMRTAEELIELTQTPILLKNCFMPKHRGKTWEEVARIDRGYLQWMLSQGPKPPGSDKGFDANTIHTLKFHLGLL